MVGMLIMRVERSPEALLVRVTTNVDIDRPERSRTEVFPDAEAAERAVSDFLRAYIERL